MPTSPLALAQRFRSQLTQIDVLQGQQLLSAYAPIRNELNASIDALLMEIELMGNPSVSRVQRSDRYKRLMDELGEKLVQFSLLLMVVMRGASHQGFVIGVENGAAMLGAYGLRANVVSADAVEQLAAFLDPSGPLYARIRNLAPYTVQRIADAISDGVAMGQNPQTIAAAIDRAFGLGLTDSLRMTRTVQIYSYRYANHASYMANGIESWSWFSRLDPGRTCFPAGTEIETARGRVPIEDVLVGDIVLTHTGAWKRVTETMSREYRGRMAEIVSAKGKIAGTTDHPVLIVRDGRAEWMEMSNVRVGDSVLHHSHHVGADFAVKAGVANPKHAKPFSSEPVRFLGVPFSDRFSIVPVLAVNFYNQVEFRDKEINGVSPSGHGVFLDKLRSNLAQAFSKVHLWRSFSGVAAIALGRAEFLALRCWNYAKALFASEAGVEDGRTSTKFAAVMTGLARLGIKLFPAPLASGVKSYASASNSAANRAIDDPILGRKNSEFVPTLRARFLRPGGLASAGQAAIGSVFSVLGSLERFITFGAFQDRRWQSYPSALGVWMDRLVLGVANSRAELSPAFGDPGGVSFEFSRTQRAFGSNHLVILPYSSENHVQHTRVYNFEVEDDHSYIANGLVVHNCMSCVQMHGSVHPATETLNDHFNGLCLALPNVAGVSLVDENGEAWFDKQSDSTQLQMMGPGRFQAYKDGALRFGELSTTHHDEVYGDMRIVAPLKDVLK
ncbi:MAG: Hint domain-containing protein [Anaerolineales bacterium]|nr:MAG: Hint domain-containing protein [Anaerolineales bacterium]